VVAARAATFIIIAVAAFLIVLAAPPAGAQSPTPNVPWTTVLPPAPGTPTNVQPRPQRRCKRPTLRCVDSTMRLMRRLRDRLGCNHRAVFADTYLLLTGELRRTLAREPRFFADRRYLIWQIVHFSDYYFRTIANDRAGRPVPEAWRIAFEAADSDGANAGQDMLLGINAHVQRDMPHVVADLGVRMRSGASRKPDHDRGNEVLNRAYERIVADVARRYDPLLFATNASWNPLDNIAGLEAVKGWREGVWRNAERLLTARTAEERAFVDASIESNAATWARMIATPQMPGYRAQRDAYCANRG
jgi:Family of unknown function (DUF5995)